MPLYVYALLLLGFSTTALADLPAGVFDNRACIQCHEKTNVTLLKDWRISSHNQAGKTVNCIACHGPSHKNALPLARRDSACISCHGGEKSPVVHSYGSSKHGVLMHLENKELDWTKRLEGANYRAPGCSYCHMHSGNHNVSATVRHQLMDRTETEKIQESTRSVCQDCHAPRYLASLLVNGEAMLEIARKKIREANDLIKQTDPKLTQDERAVVKKQMETMQQHFRNVYLGIGHQSPDYQWWYGQPALDGDLIKIKGKISDSLTGQNKEKHD